MSWGSRNKTSPCSNSSTALNTFSSPTTFANSSAFATFTVSLLAKMFSDALPFLAQYEIQNMFLYSLQETLIAVVAVLAVDSLHRAHLASVREELRPANSLKAKARRLVRFAHRRDVKKNATKHDLDPSEWFFTLPLNFRELLEIVQLFGMQLGHLVDHENVALAEAPKNNSPISPPPDETQCTFLRSLPISRHSPRPPMDRSVSDTRSCLPRWSAK